MVLRGTNRTDLVGVPPTTEANRPEQGTAAANERSLAAVPIQRPPMPTGPVSRPSERPGEPVTAGLPVGAGPTAAPLPSRNDVTMAKMVGLLKASGDPQLAILIGRLRRSRGI